MENIQYAVCIALFQLQQAALPRQELQVQLYPQALQYLAGELVIETSGLAIFLVDVGRPGIRDQAQRFAAGGEGATVQ